MNNSYNFKKIIVLLLALILALLITTIIIMLSWNYLSRRQILPFKELKFFDAFVVFILASSLFMNTIICNNCK